MFEATGGDPEAIESSCGPVRLGEKRKVFSVMANEKEENEMMGSLMQVAVYADQRLLVLNWVV